MARTATIRPAIADHAGMVAAIVDAYRAATPEDIAAGTDWYPTAGRMVRDIAGSAGIGAKRVAYALAALSPRNPWRWNVADAYRFAHADPCGPIPTATTFAVNRARAWSALHDHAADPWTTAAPKVRAFVAAILGEPTAVVVDTWAVRVATAGAIAEVRGDAEYAAIADAYRAAAGILGVWERDVQAVTWVAAERIGLGSNRRGRHGETFKSGTPAAVVALFGRDGTAI